MADQTSVHEASASALGYLFQCRYALLAAVRAIADFPELSISIEKFDDVAFDANGVPAELIQTKHQLKSSGSLTNASTDIWKTLRIWVKAVEADPSVPFRTRFTLLTTGTAPEGSAAALLRARDRNEDEADKLLMSNAATSGSKENAEAYAAYKGLPKAQRNSLLKAILILDRSPNILDVHDELLRELRHAVSRDHLGQFIERLEGWWFGIVIKALAGVGPTSIGVLIVDGQIDGLREQFRRSALPVDYATAVPPAAIVAELDKRPFVRQLRKIEIGNQRVEYAIRDFYRASEQRSKWAREDLLVDGELEKYENELTEAWQPRYAAMVDELPATCDLQARVAAGQSLFKWAETEANFPLRTVRDRFLTHGSYHVLANRFALGWHPDYQGDASDADDVSDPKS